MENNPSPDSGGTVVLVSLGMFVLPFWDDPALSSFSIWGCFVVGTLGLATAFGFYKTHHKIALLILFLFVLRIGYNQLLLPNLAQENSVENYEPHVQEVLRITEGQPVRWCGYIYLFESDASVGPITFEKSELVTPTLMAYQVPYLLTRENGYIMQYDTILEPGQFYLSHDDFLRDKTVEKLYEFEDRWMKKNLILFKATKPEYGGIKLFR
ncbi:hypothetical protein KFE98_10730 [bacterium SCSIO 12741]|nr:hypothetical protein KFE98_10730 [bacterium SCSIO 12741]